MLKDASSCIYGVFSNLRLRGCGAANLQAPRIMQTAGKGRFMLDVGLGNDAAETAKAVENGFVVFSFELLPGNIESIMKKREKDQRFHFLHLTKDTDGKWITPVLPEPPSGGVAYVHLAGLSDVEGTAHMHAKGTSLVLNAESGTGSVEVPLLPLPRLIPDWAKNIEFLKLDTQGYELKILKGAMPMLEAKRFHYVQYEFSPWLMKRGKFGNPLELLYLLPNMRALCFDMMGVHNNLPHPTKPLESYYDVLDGGAHGSWRKVIGKNDPFGPWDDIMCYWPDELSDVSCPVLGPVTMNVSTTQSGTTSSSPSMTSSSSSSSGFGFDKLEEKRSFTTSPSSLGPQEATTLMPSVSVTQVASASSSLSNSSSLTIPLTFYEVVGIAVALVLFLCCIQVQLCVLWKAHLSATTRNNVARGATADTIGTPQLGTEYPETGQLIA